MPYSDLLALIKEFLKKQVLNQTVFFWYSDKVFFASNFFYFWLDFHKNCHEFSTEKALTTHKIFLC